MQTFFFFFFNDTATTEIYTLSLHDALPISRPRSTRRTAARTPRRAGLRRLELRGIRHLRPGLAEIGRHVDRSEEHTSELQSLRHLVCRLLLEKKKNMCPARINETRTLDGRE